MESRLFATPFAAIWPGAERSYDADHKHTSQLEDTVFNSARDADKKNPLHNRCVHFKFFSGEKDQIVRIMQKRKKHHSCHTAGNQRRNGDSRYSQFQHIHADCISHNVDDIHQQRYFQCDLRIPIERYSAAHESYTARSGNENTEIMR